MKTMINFKLMHIWIKIAVMKIWELVGTKMSLVIGSEDYWIRMGFQPLSWAACRFQMTYVLISKIMVGA